MLQEDFSILSARVPSGSLPQSILNESSARVTLALYSVAQPEVAVFIRTYTNVSALSARSHQLYQNANIFGLERSFSSAPTVQQFEICIQRRSRSQANERSDFRIAPFSGTPASLPQRTSSPADQFRFAQLDHQSISPKPTKHERKSSMLCFTFQRMRKGLAQQPGPNDTAFDTRQRSPPQLAVTLNIVGSVGAHTAAIDAS